MKLIKTPETYTLTEMVKEENFASTVKSGSLDVLATPTLAAWFEYAACKLLEGYLEDEETTVGTLLELHHNAPTTLGDTVKIEITLTEQNGRELVFEASAFDSAGEVAKCSHKRFIVYKTKFMDKAKSRRV